MTWFTGTSTGQRYNVGQVYQSANGDLKRANADGSFTNLRTGRTNVGSSQSDRVQWGGGDSQHGVRLGGGFVERGFGNRELSRQPSGGGGGSSRATPAPAPSKPKASAPSVPSRGPGNPSAGRSPSTGPGQVKPVRSGDANPGTGPGLGVVTIGGVYGAVEPTRGRIGGYLIDADPSWSDMQVMEDRYGDAEFLDPMWFYKWGITGADTVRSLKSESRKAWSQRDSQSSFVRMFTDGVSRPGRSGGW